MGSRTAKQTIQYNELSEEDKEKDRVIIKKDIEIYQGKK
jgi:hypothetical protein